MTSVIEEGNSKSSLNSHAVADSPPRRLSHAVFSPINHSEMLGWERLANRYNENAIPLYLSYPVESYWRQAIDPVVYANSLRQNDISFLYVHFPYCKRICHYCLCYHEGYKDARDIDVYLRYLVKEMDIKLSQAGIAGKLSIRHMHWGGGTPTLLTPQQIEKVHSDITKRVEFVRDGENEFSIEAYPDETIITRDKLLLLQKLGFNTISFGVQDFDERVQSVINREHKPDAVHSLMALARELGFRVHVDLCYGLPFQGLNELQKTLLEIVKSQPLRISVNPYAHNPFVFPGQKIIPLSSVPNSFMKIMQAILADDILTECGYVRIGLDQYIKPEDPYFESLRKHGIRSLMGYSTNEKVSFLGCGATAISYFDNSFYMNSARLKEYYQQIDHNSVPLDGKRCYRYNDDDRIRNQVIQKFILGHFEIDKKQFARECNADFDCYFKEEIAKLARHEKDGLVDLSDPDFIRITKKGRFFGRHIAHVFDTFYAQERS